MSGNSSSAIWTPHSHSVFMGLWVFPQRAPPQEGSKHCWEEQPLRAISFLSTQSGSS